MQATRCIFVYRCDRERMCVCCMYLCASLNLRISMCQCVCVHLRLSVYALFCQNLPLLPFYWPVFIWLSMSGSTRPRVRAHPDDCGYVCTLAGTCVHLCLFFVCRRSRVHVSLRLCMFACLRPHLWTRYLYVCRCFCMLAYKVALTPCSRISLFICIWCLVSACALFHLRMSLCTYICVSVCSQVLLCVCVWVLIFVWVQLRLSQWVTACQCRSDCDCMSVHTYSWLCQPTCLCATLFMCTLSAHASVYVRVGLSQLAPKRKPLLEAIFHSRSALWMTPSYF